MASLEGFSRNINARSSRMVKAVDQVIRRIALVADRHLVLATPVDTGRARSNWLVSVGTPITTPIEPYFPHAEGSGGGGQTTGETANAQAAINQGLAAIGSRKPGQAIYIYNNVDYIQRLDAGSSQQAPANFVRTAVLNAVAVVRKIRITD